MEKHDFRTQKKGGSLTSDIVSHEIEKSEGEI
jgi:hypothetical protein